MHSHKGGLTLDLMNQTTLMRRYEQIRKLHLKKIKSKIYPKS